MVRSKAIPGFHFIDGRLTYTDSKSEAAFIRSLVRKGFSGKWRRRFAGLSFGYTRYTPDVELSVMHGGRSRRALVEYKSTSRQEFSVNDRRRMLASARYYGRLPCFLYVQREKQWYSVEKDGMLRKTQQPIPGEAPIKNYFTPVPLSVPIFNKYGRLYFDRLDTFLLRKTADAIEFILKEIFGAKNVGIGRTKYRKRTRRR